jgi:hypothetical protein
MPISDFLFWEKFCEYKKKGLGSAHPALCGTFVYDTTTAISTQLLGADQSQYHICRIRGDCSRWRVRDHGTRRKGFFGLLGLHLKSILDCEDAFNSIVGRS